ncbi:MAG: 50S ribosomal protein L30 [Anaerolineales bacterium]
MAKKKKTPRLRVTLVKSASSRTPRQRKTVEALGLRKINQTVEIPDNESVRGMIACIDHLVEVEEAA